MVLTMDRWVGKVAVVTGASSGCGAAISQALVKHGLKVVGLARREDKLKILAHTLNNEKGEFYPRKADITIEEDIIKVFKWTRENIGPVAVLVNNAGISQMNSLIGGDTQKWRNVLDTNILGLSIATREAIQQMEENHIAGQIIHISSVLGHYVAHVPNINMYSASKHAVRALVETLRQELLAKKSKIRIASVSPGPIDTEFAIASNLCQDQHYKEVWENLPKLKAEDVADSCIYILSTPSYVQVQDIMMRPLGEQV